MSRIVASAYVVLDTRAAFVDLEILPLDERLVYRHCHFANSLALIASQLAFPVSAVAAERFYTNSPTTETKDKLSVSSDKPMSNIPPDRCRVPQAFWRAIEGIGLTAAAVLRQARLPGTLHLGDQGFVTTAQYFSLWKALEDLTADPGLSIRLVTGTATAVHPPSSLCAFYARDYRDGLARTARFKRLCTPEQLHFTEEENTFTIRTSWLHATEPEPTIATQVAFACLMELGRRGTGRHLTPRWVELTCSAPKSDVHRAYFGCEIHYGASQNALVLKTADLDHPFPGHNPELLEMLTPVLASALDEIQAHSSIREQVKIVLKRGLPSGRPELSEVARDLAMSERTLQRRITDEAATFRELLMEARQELGRQLLSDPSATIDEVACLLGYQDTSSFYRAFRDWEGVTPSQWRGTKMGGYLSQKIPFSHSSLT